jgi:hypothetical protein
MLYYHTLSARLPFHRPSFPPTVVNDSRFSPSPHDLSTLVQSTHCYQASRRLIELSPNTVLMTSAA